MDNAASSDEDEDAEAKAERLGQRLAAAAAQAEEDGPSTSGREAAAARVRAAAAASASSQKRQSRRRKGSNADQEAAAADDNAGGGGRLCMTAGTLEVWSGDLQAARQQAVNPAGDQMLANGASQIREDGIVAGSSSKSVLAAAARKQRQDFISQKPGVQVDAFTLVMAGEQCGSPGCR